MEVGVIGKEGLIGLPLIAGFRTKERLARWLLMSADRVGTSSLTLTQEVLGQMLGARRSSVTVAAGILQKAGLISYTRGDEKIVQRAKLENAACECYGLMRQQVKVWQSQTD